MSADAPKIIAINLHKFSKRCLRAFYRGDKFSHELIDKFMRESTVRGLPPAIWDRRDHLFFAKLSGEICLKDHRPQPNTHYFIKEK